MNKISIIGTGSVGATIAYSIAMLGMASEIVMIDINNEKALGEALAQGVGGAAGPQGLSAHHRAPSRLAKLMRGSAMPMRMSPNSSPRMDSTA